MPNHSTPEVTARSDTSAPRSRDAQPQGLTRGEAAEWLAHRDPVIAHLAAMAGPPKFPRPAESHFAALVRSVTAQQLAGPAARAIHGRLVEALDNNVTPEQFATVSDETLRSCGLSGRKVLSLRELADKVVDGSVRLDNRGIARKGDQQIVDQLTSVRGIGKWTAEMFLMFQARRLDIWPTGDLELRKGYALAWNVDLPKPKQLDVLGDEFRPYRSLAAWYCWKALSLR